MSIFHFTVKDTEPNAYRVQGQKLRELLSHPEGCSHPPMVAWRHHGLLPIPHEGPSRHRESNPFTKTHLKRKQVEHSHPSFPQMFSLMSHILSSLTGPPVSFTVPLVSCFILPRLKIYSGGLGYEVKPSKSKSWLSHLPASDVGQVT